MNNFEYNLEHIQTDHLMLDYFLVPWDTEILEQPVAEISHIEVRDIRKAGNDFQLFSRWCEKQDITLCSCRIGHDRLVEATFLEAQGFRFIELNYRPTLKGLQELEIPDDTIVVRPANYKDREILAEMAGTVFKCGRIHQDPLLGPGLGNRRYREWLLNGFELPHQNIFTCVLNGEIAAFFLVEFPEQGSCFWSLNGLAPGRQGQGLGARIWRTMLRWHQREGIETISTSISSHNIAAFNLYISLGFRFPAPDMMFHHLSQEFFSPDQNSHAS